MTYANTTLLGLNQPATGSESGVWGDDINNGTTQLIEVSIVGSNTISYDGNVTLSVSNGSNASSFGSTTTTSTSSGVAQYPTLILTGARTALRTITAPSSSRIYRVINQTTGGYNTIVNGSATTGVSIPPGASATLIWNGSDFQGVSTVVGNLTFTDTNILASYQTSVNTYSQIVNQNSNSGATASADFIVGNNNTTATTYYGDFGMNSSGFTGSGAFNAANAVYLTSTSGDLAIGTTTSNAIHFVTNSGTTDAMTISSAGTVTISGNYPITSVTSISAVTGTPSSSNYLRGDGTWSTIPATSPGGSNTQVQYNSSGSFAGSANFTFNGTTVTMANDSTIHGLTVGLGGGSVSNNTAVGASALAANTNGVGNTAIGNNTLPSLSTGSYNTAVGDRALNATTGLENTGVGQAALYTNTSGSYNVAVGRFSLGSNTTASNNTAVGYKAAYSNTAANVTAFGSNALYANTTGTLNTAIGQQSLNQNTTGSSNSTAGVNTLYSNTTGSYNTAVGDSALLSNTTASNNTAVGYQAAYSNTTGALNFAAGAYALYGNTTGSNNTAVGVSALQNGTASVQNTGVGFQALQSNTTGTNSVAVGYNALQANNTGTNNTAVGSLAAYSNTTGSSNTAIGLNSLVTNTTGSNNVAVGQQALNSNTTASYNTAVGYQAGYSASASNYNVFIGQGAGYNANYSGSAINTFVGTQAGYYITSGIKNTIIGNYSGNFGGLDIRTASNYIVLSDGDGNPRQIINNSGFLFYYTMNSGAGTNTLKYNTSTGAVTYDTSSARYKDNIRDSIYGLSHVMQMRSAQFEYKDNGRSDVGLIAEELDPIIPELVGKNKDGQPDSVSYDRMVSVLVKAIQELNTLVTAQAAEIQSLKAEVATLKGA